MRTDTAGPVLDAASGYVSLGIFGATAHIAYYDGTHGDLRLALWDGQAWTDEQLDGDAADVGRFASLAMDRLGHHSIAYYDATNQAVKYIALGLNSTPDQYVTNVITSVVGVTSLSLALTMGEAWSAHIAYTSLVSNTVGVLAYAGGWRNDVVESGGGAAPSGVSLVVSDRERLTYIVGGSLRYAWRSATLQIPEFNALRPCTDTAVDQNAFYTARVSLSFLRGTGQPKLIWAVAVGRWALRGVLLFRREPGSRRHQPQAGCLCA